MKSLQDLTGAKSNWPLIKDMMDKATNTIEVLPKDPKAAEESIVALQQSVESLMGAITYETGGILIDSGWLRILGSGHEHLKRDIAGWNLDRTYSEDETPGFLMVADDVLGGIFAVNGTELGEDAGKLYYLAPDTVEWEALDVTYQEFLEFCFLGQVQDFYSHFRWDGWQEEIKKISGDEAIMFNPPLWSDELNDNIGERERSVIPMEEAYELLLEINNLMIEEEDYEEEEGCGCGENSCECGDDCGCSDDDEDCGCSH